MGNFIVRASHVGVSMFRDTRSSYPASDEEMEIAKRAAQKTRERWKKQQGKGRPKKYKNPQNIQGNKPGSEAVQPKRARHANSYKLAPHLRENKSQGIGKHGSFQEKASVAAISKEQRAAQRLGISEIELQRRISALRAWNHKG